MYILVFVLMFPLAIAQKSTICDDRFTLITDIEQEDCDEGKYLMYKDESCYPTCEEVVRIDCDIAPCKPGYKCVYFEDEPHGIEEYTCEVDEKSCFKYYFNYTEDDNPYIKAMWPPTCELDGTWTPTQLKGEEANGRVFCVDEEGNRIFGHAWSTEATNMTCACSRQRIKLEKDPSNWFVGLHCDSQGNYEPMQCTHGHCWCADEKTGDLQSPVVPEAMWTFLPCYDEKVNGERYMRQCESELYAQKKVLRELEIHGTKGIKYNPLICDADGSYGSYKVITGSAFCTWRDNSNLGSFQSDAYEDMTCNCARDKKLYELEGIPHNLNCEQKGNYNPIQSVGNQFFCVDSDGFQISEMLDEKPSLKDCGDYK